MLQQKRESTLLQLQVRVAIDKHFSLLVGSDDVVRDDVMSFPAFIGPKIISDGQTNRMSISQLSFQISVYAHCSQLY